jgi:hypothetical protein
MADPRMGARKERLPLRGTADGAVGPLSGVPRPEGAGASHESPKAWEGQQES